MNPIMMPADARTGQHTLAAWQDYVDVEARCFSPARIRRCYLYRTSRRLFGKRFYLTLDGTSWTWLSDIAARQWALKADWKCIDV